MATLINPFINRKATKKGRHQYEGGGDAANTVYCRWYWIEVVVGRTTHQGGQVHHDEHTSGTLFVPDPLGWEEDKQHTSGTVTLKSSDKQGKFAGSGVVTEGSATVTIP